MAIFAPLSIGKQALLASERALGVTGHNIANVNTPGYSRQAGRAAGDAARRPWVRHRCRGRDGRAIGRRRCSRRAS